MASVMVNLGMFTLRLFGNPHIEADGEFVSSLGTRKAMALAAYLAVTGNSYSRDALVALLWPELDQQRGRAALRSTLSALKKGLADTGLVVDGDHVTLSLADVACDVVQFQAHLAATQRHRHRDNFVCDACLAALKAAVALYRDDFMAGFSLRDSVAFDEWQFFQTEQLRGQLAQALGRLVASCGERAQWQEALAYAQRWLMLDPLQEAAQRALMQVYGEMGQLTAVQRQFQKCVDLLRDELGVEPSAETVAVYEAAKKGKAGDLQLEISRSDRTQSPKAQQPDLHSLTPLVGRTAELAQIEARLADPTCRLLTLVGSGGMGKTRLGLETAVHHQAPFIPLASVSDAGHLVAAMAAALNFSFYGTEPPQTQLLDFLREKSLLLVLDNFEHLLEGATFLLTILQHAPAIKMLVTSRERLHVRGEWIVEISGLPVEGKNETAVQLFVQAAQRIHPNFLAEAQLTDVRRICQLVEGMPLAIELAAAWVRVLDCAEIAQEIEHNLDFLATNLRDLPERHRSLRAVFDHSWQLLTEAERLAFQRLSVFRGGFERGAATAVTNAQLPTLLALVDKSLLRRDGDGRYHIPEALRQFAAEKRRAIESELKREHAHYFAHFLQVREAALKGGGQQKETLAEIGVEIENVRQAWRWAVEQGAETAVAQAMESLFLYYEMRSLFQEGAEMFGAAGVVGVRARYGRFLQRLGRYTEAKSVLKNSLEAARTAGDLGEVAFVLLNLGYVAWSLSDYEAARRLYEESLTLYRQLGQQWGAARVLNAMAIIPQDLAQMKSLLEGSLAISQEIGDLWGVARALNNLGMVTRDVPEAQQLYQRAIAICREIDDRYLMIFPLINLGHMVRMQGDFAEARRLYEESLASCREIGYRAGVARCWGHLGTAAFALGDYEQAADYCQQGLPLCQELGDQRGLGLLHYTLGLAAQEQDTAVTHFQQSLTIFREAGDKQGEAWPLLGLAQAAQQRGDDVNVQKYAQESLAIFEQVGDKDGLVRVQTLLGHWQVALETAVSLQATPLIMEVLISMAAQTKPELGLAVARFVVGQTAVEWHTREQARGLVEKWEGVGVATAVTITSLEMAIKTLHK